MKEKAFWFEDNRLFVIDQRKLPFEKSVLALTTSQEVTEAIKDMTVRGAGVIGNVAAFGAYFAADESKSFEEYLQKIVPLKNARPTAVNLIWAVDRATKAIELSHSMKDGALKEAREIERLEIDGSEKIGEHGLELIKEIMKQKNRDSINILTHCNAGYLAIAGYGSALAPIYKAKEAGIKVKVYVDETRPRNQGANLTAWELSQEGVEHEIIADNTGGLLMMRGMVDMCIVGSDRVARNGDVANKIGTYLKALAAHDNGVPFFVALPTSTIDMSCPSGADIEIEIRGEEELNTVRGVDKDGNITEINIYPKGANALNYGFDTTPAKLVTALITEKGACKPNEIEKFLKGKQ